MIDLLFIRQKAALPHETKRILKIAFSMPLVEKSVKNPTPSLRGAKRRGNLLVIRTVMRLPQ